jgi:hypothetical protein
MPTVHSKREASGILCDDGRVQYLDGHGVCTTMHRQNDIALCMHNVNFLVLVLYCSY